MSLFLHISCTILAQSCTYLARNGARFCKSCCKNNYLHFLHIFCPRIGARLCKNRARKGKYRVHVPSKSCMQDSCKILAQSCMILQVRFCWVPPSSGAAHQKRSVPRCVLLGQVAIDLPSPIWTGGLMTPKAGSGQHCLRLALHLGGNYAVADLASAEKLYCFVISVNCPPLREISMVTPPCSPAS